LERVLIRETEILDAAASTTISVRARTRFFAKGEPEITEAVRVAELARDRGASKAHARGCWFPEARGDVTADPPG